MRVVISAKAQRTDRGAAAVEFALVLPLLVILVFGIIDFGRLFHAQITVTQGAREGSRLAALGLPDVENRTAQAATGLGLTASAVTVTACPVGATQTTDAVVSVRYTLNFSTPMTGLVGLPASKVLTGTGYMPCQG